MDFSFTSNALGSPAGTPLGTPSGQAPTRRDTRPPITPGPGGYQQTGSSYATTAPAAYSQSQALQSGTQQGYFPPPQASPAAAPYPNGQDNASMDGLTGQVGAMGLASRPHKKKDRHAYHQLETPAANDQAFNGAPSGAAPSQFISNNAQNAPLPGSPAPPYMSQQVTPAMSQFPAAANNHFTPADQASSMQHAARQGDQLLGAPASSAQGRVDPDQIPSVPKSRDLPARYYLERIYPTMEQHLPPPAAVPFIAFDQGNSSPKFARLTLNSIPTSSDALASTGLPLGLVLQPLAPLQEGEQPIPVLDFGDVGPPRCRRCRAYINPFMTFRSGGNKFVCNMCTHPNDVSPEYFAPTDPSGMRVDRGQRPELTLGTVEFMVPKEYWAKDPVPLQWFFVIDVSSEASSRGFLEGFCSGLLHALYGEDDASSDGPNPEQKNRLPPGSKVGIVTYDREVHFYNLSAGLEQAQMMVMPDIEEPFVPLSQGLFVDPEASKTVITSLLSQIPQMFSVVKNPEPALLPTLNAALSALASTGGKILCSLSTLPTFGPGRLIPRDKNEGRDTDAEKKLYTTEHPGWRKTAAKMVEAGVGVDFFMAAPSGGYLDIATIGMCTNTLVKSTRSLSTQAIAALLLVEKHSTIPTSITRETF